MMMLLKSKKREAMLLFTGFNTEENSQNKATLNLEARELLSNLGADFEPFLRSCVSKVDVGSASLFLTRNTHWRTHTKGKQFAPYGCPTSNILFNCFLKRSGKLFYLHVKSRDSLEVTVPILLRMIYLKTQFKNFYICCTIFLFKRIMTTKNNTIDNMVKLSRRQRQINESTQSTSKFKPNSTTS